MWSQRRAGGTLRHERLGCGARLSRRHFDVAPGTSVAPSEHLCRQLWVCQPIFRYRGIYTFKSEKPTPTIRDHNSRVLREYNRCLLHLRAPLRLFLAREELLYKRINLLVKPWLYLPRLE